ncbi:MAG: TetR/AcrR family transcriptional regulator [Bryobacteraceae bacterium]
MAYRTSEKMAERKRARRRRFLDTAIAVFGRLGYHAATVPMIVAEAGSSTGAFYLYFRNKEDVYAEALFEIGARLAAALNTAIARETGTAAQMAAAVEGFVRWLAENPPETRMLMEAASLGGRPEEVRREVIESHVRSVAAALERAAPWIDAADRGVVARCWTGAVIEAAAAWLRMPPAERPDAARLASTVKSFNLRGVGLDAGK